MNRNHLALLALLVLVALAGCSWAPTSPGGDDTSSGEDNASEDEPAKAPEEWPDRKVLDEDLREGEAKDEMKYRNETAGEEIQFAPKEMNESTLPENEEEAEMIRTGAELMSNTSEEMPEHVGNELTCANCHGGEDPSISSTDGLVGQDIRVIPLVGTEADLPEWTARRDQMRDTRQRLMGCFERSMNAPDSEEGAPSYDSEEMQAMEAYMQWLSEGVPTKAQPYWSHLNQPDDDEQKPVEEVNPVRGADLYLEECASCHGDDGQGVDDVGPPLWGSDSYNDGAGMARVYTSSAFIREAMPYETPHEVSDWDDVQDIAGFMNGHERPEFPEKDQDFPTRGTPNQSVYYEDAQEDMGYDQNPMQHKLELAGLPTGNESISEDDIPDDTDRYDEPLRDE